MGRKAGVTKDETRADLLDAAAKVVAERGFDRASISDITAAAGLTSGSVYGHFDGKADLFAAMLSAHADQELDGVLGTGGELDVATLLTVLGGRLGARRPERGSLLVEAVVAARRDPAIAKQLGDHFRGREKQLTALIKRAQEAGEIDAAIEAEAAARLSIMVVLGSLVIQALDMPRTNQRGWQALIARLVDGLRDKRARS